MSTLLESLGALRSVTWVDVLDILLVALIFYMLLRLFQGTQAIQLLRGMILLVLIVGLLSSLLRLQGFSWLLRNSISALFIAIPVIFQPELRRGLERLGRTGNILGRQLREERVEEVIRELVVACETLSAARHGALIVLERSTGLQDYIETGAKLDSTVSAELLQTIFFPNTALHDGAVILRGDRIVAARCLLPLAERLPAHGHMGTRHRAALGITEQTDAVAVVVSEETGIISVTHNGRMIRRLGEGRLASVLRAFYQGQSMRRVLPE